ncbi:MAG: hypothetical protein J0L97_05280 [Alphaproteobacteria bacterium]|nr:hypothetical protein [Alphaproteobacteria bacterium]
MSAITVWWGAKKIALRFDSDEAEIEPAESGTLLFTAQGKVTFQDAEAVERLLLGRVPCRWEVMREGETILNETYDTTLFALEPDQLIASLSVSSS